MTPHGRPRLRGVSHQYAFFLSLITGAMLVASSSSGTARLAAISFAIPISLMFGTSALYHRITWRPRARGWVRRLDHAAVFLVIGGTYTAYGLLALHGAWRVTILAIVWAGVLAVIVQRFVWVGAPKWIATGVGVGLGWLAVVALPQFFDDIGPGGVALLVLGGVCYTAGGIIYALHRPDPRPAVFGYHEIFHALVIVAVAFQYASIGFFLLR